METKTLPSDQARENPNNIDEQNLKVFFTPSKRKKTRRISVLIQGEFTVNNVLLLKEQIFKVFINYDHADFVINSITQIDLSAIQLLFVIKSIFSESKKIVTLDFDLKKEDRLIMYHSGFSDLLIKPKLTE
jgi:anti-anti-sigma regulatory factor